MKIQHKVMLSSAIPFIAALILGLNLIMVKYDDYNLAYLIKSNIDMLASSSSVVTELQKERGLSSIYVSSKNESDLQNVLKQRAVVDEVKGQLLVAAKETYLDKDIVEGAVNQLGKLESLRRQVDGLAITRADLLKEYTGAIRSLLNIGVSVVKGKTSFGLGKQIVNLVVLLEAQESAALLRGSLSGVFASDKGIPVEQLEKSISINSQMLDNLHSPVLLMSNENQEKLNLLFNDASWKKVQEMMSVLLQKYSSGSFGINGNDFFIDASKVVGQIIEIQNGEKNEIIKKVSTVARGALVNIWLVSIIFIIFTILLLVWLFIFSQRLNQFAAYLLKANQNVANSTKEISAGNQDLSSRTEEQASSLEETASTLEEITATVKQTADNSNKANSVTRTTVKLADEGVDLSKNTYEAMQEISTSSSRIVDIVSLVEEIAFQTNILAINAAIEAAKAGEQGKGFAVVAIEVRELAQRVAGATKDIKTLIDLTLTKVKNGEELVASSNTKLSEISEGIRKVSDLMSEISAASGEQFRAVEQINLAVSQLDSVTQQNASLVEEIAASSENMSQQANDMLGLVQKNF